MRNPAQTSPPALIGAILLVLAFPELLRHGTDGAALARAAQSHGQEDDITVLTLTYAAKLEAIPA